MRDTKAKHTPGPWKVRNAHYIGRSAYYVDPVNERGPHDSVCVAVIRQGWLVEESEANARLIAAAPALLEGCRVALDALESPEARHVYSVIQREKLRAAIAQATEETP